ncbi:UTRA domain-containing protein [Terrarubrum flagellatum]|uniref:UTRA domain-containing protein n=1 Tax=Terrirubrum flagellatum TaxID=2895980 RepID=UPI0031455E84
MDEVVSQSRSGEIRLDGQGPVYDQIRRALADLIASGAWPPGTPVPPERQLMSQLDASRMTVHRALSALADAGLIQRRRRSGSVVASPTATHAALELLSIPEEVKRSGHAYRFTILSRRAGLAGAELAERFGVSARERVLHIVTRHFSDDTPHVLEDRIIHLAAAPEAEHEAFAEKPPGDWLIENSLWSDAEHIIGAAEATREEAQWLRIQPGAACLTIERRTWTRGAAITAVKFLYPAGRQRLVGRFTPPALAFSRRS